MNPWRNYPLVRIACSLGSGAGLMLLFPGMVVPPLWVPGLLMAFVCLLAMFPSWIGSYAYRWVPGLLILANLFLAGIWLVRLAEPVLPPGQETRESSPRVYCGIVVEQPLMGGKTIRLLARVGMKDSTGNPVICGPAVITAEYDQHTGIPGIGDVLVFYGYLGRIGERDNPGGFDRKRWYGIKGIALESYVKKGEWKIVGRGGQWSVKRLSDRLRGRLLEVLRESGLSGQEFAVASALLLGYVHDIDRELMRGYSATGAMHVLSVSGMHVGVVYLFLEFLLGFMKRKRGLVIVRASIIILSIWFYAFLTGLSPPVTRAALMLSLVVAGKTLSRSPEILNIVAASFLCQVVADPLIPGDIGFQFSYLAVVGIVLMYRPVYDIYVTSNVFADKAWALIAVSITAQLATFPLGIYAFHQFPNYFLLTNFVVVPFSNFIIYTGILLLIVGSIPIVGPFFGMLLSWMIKGLNESILFIGGLPGAVTGGIYISEIQLVLVFLMIITLFLFFLKKRPFLLMLFLIVLVLFQVEALRRDAIRRTGDEFVLYKSGGMTVADFIHGDRSVMVRSDASVALSDFFRSVLADHWIHKGIRARSASYLGDETGDRIRWDHPLLPLTRQGNFFIFEKKRIYFLRSTIPSGSPLCPPLDFLVIGEGVTNDLKEILSVFHPRMIILDSSCKRWRCREWMKEAAEMEVEVYCVNELGAYIIRF